MHYGIIKDKKLTGLIVNATYEDAVRCLNKWNPGSTLIRVFLKKKVPAFWRSCTFGPEFSKLKLLSRIWLRFKGVDYRDWRAKAEALARKKKWVGRQNRGRERNSVDLG